jgi:hypothetical protein
MMAPVLLEMMLNVPMSKMLPVYPAFLAAPQ